MKTLKIMTMQMLILVLCISALADVPNLINYQGRLTNTLGVPVPNASYSVTFTIYDALTGGSNLWSETNSVTTSSGLFAVLLGNNVALPDLLFSDTIRYIGIQVSPDPELIPRQRLVSSPYSYRVHTVDGARGGTITSKVSIGSGHTNTGTDAFVAGANNQALANYSAIGGGSNNMTISSYCTVGGGNSNTASGIGPTVGGGLSNSAIGQSATVGGGQANSTSGQFSTVGGGNSNTASNQSATVGGGESNRASNYAAVGGGQYDTATGTFSTIGGGYDNTASGISATVGGGGRNTASGDSSTVGGGGNNTASGNRATVGGGERNNASGVYATVPGGLLNTASGISSFAAGSGAEALHDQTFVWSNGAIFSSTGVDQFLISAPGGVGIGTNSPAHPLHLGSGAHCTAGGVWTNASSRELKTDIEPLKNEEYSDILKKLEDLEVVHFKYKAEPDVAHIGMIAEDVPDEMASPDRKGIPTADAIAFLMAAVKAQQSQIEELKATVKDLKEKLKEKN